MFLDNIDLHDTNKPGQGDQIIRKYNKLGNEKIARSAGIGENPQTVDDDEYKFVVKADIDEIIDLLKTGRYKKVAINVSKGPTKKNLIGENVSSVILKTDGFELKHELNNFIVKTLVEKISMFLTSLNVVPKPPKFID